MDNTKEAEKKLIQYLKTKNIQCNINKHCTQYGLVDDGFM